MRPLRALLVFVPFLLLAALDIEARQRAVQHPAGRPFSDTFSFAQPEKITTRHLTLDLTVDFEKKELRGSATLELENHGGTRTLVLDTYGLRIARVTRDGEPATWSLGANTPFGRPLTIEIEPSTRSVSIDYATTHAPETAPGAFQAILSWNAPEQTFAEKAPYLYSLNEPIGARSWMPVQDTPVVRMTYEATLRVPPGLLALMSAAGNPTAVNPSGVYMFRMPYDIPAYLIALAVGRLEFHAFDGRTGVYAEPELLAEAAWELASMPEMMEVAERIAGPFPFSRHDVLLMPPTFGLGGMEHPMLNFVQPISAVVGDHAEKPFPKRLIAHELAHSWAGDATTLGSWNDVWLNEGFATYLAHRILEEMLGAELSELAWFDQLRGYRAYVGDDPPDHSVLHRRVLRPTHGFDPTSYEKGALFLRTIEDRLGRARFDSFLRRYFETLRWQSVDHVKFLEIFEELVHPSESERASLRLQDWIYGRGVPSNVTAPTSSAIRTRVTQRLDAFRFGTPIAQMSPATWTDVELSLFLALGSEDVRGRMAEIDAALGLSARRTPPRDWMLHAIRARYEPGIAAAERVLLRGTPYSWMYSLYAQFDRYDRSRGVEIFGRARGGYYAVLERQIAVILKLAGGSGARALKNAA